MGKRIKNKPVRPITIFFLRHGDPENPKRLIKGMAAFPLSKKGREQIKAQVKKLQNERIAAIFTSPALRCQQTAQLVASVLNQGLPKKSLEGPGGVKIKVTTQLSEWRSSLDGQPETQAKKMPLTDYNRTFEPKEKVLKRMKEFVKTALSKYPGERIVAVSHQGPIDLLLFSLAGKDVSQMPGRGLVTKMAELVKVSLNQELQIQKIERMI